MNERPATTFAASIGLWSGLASRLLGWRPNDFWKATPAELALAFHDPEPSSGTAPPSRALIAELMERDRNE